MLEQELDQELDVVALAVDVFSAVIESAESEEIEATKVIKVALAAAAAVLPHRGIKEMELSPKTEKRTVISSKDALEQLGDVLAKELKNLAAGVADLAGDEAARLNLDIEVRPEAEELARTYKRKVLKLVEKSVEDLTPPPIKIMRDTGSLIREFEKRVKGLVL